MRYAIMGAGAVGCYFGGLLARAGHGVTLIGRPVHVDAIRARGLRLQTQAWDQTLSLAATCDAQGVAEAEVVLVCVKSADTEAAGAAMRAHLRPEACVLSLQNGVDNAARLAEALGRPVVPAAVYVACGMVGPGHVQHHGRGELVIGPCDAAEAFAADCAQAGIAVEVSPDVAGALWGKLVINCVYNALSALTQLPYGALVRQAGMWDVMQALYQECVAVAQAEGVSLPSGTWAAVERIAVSMATQLSSTARDLMQGKPTEIEHLNGYVVRQAAAHGLAVPTNRLLLTLVQAAGARTASA
jgi:2-dehydropantoate 2-reductase